MKITKRQLRRIIKEEKTKLLSEITDEQLTNINAEQSALHMSGRNQSVMDQLHTAIDALIDAMGNEEAHQELLGIVEEWDTETHPSNVYEGTSSKNMPDAWQQILGTCLKRKK
jgi:hypothetical protein